MMCALRCLSVQAVAAAAAAADAGNKSGAGARPVTAALWQASAAGVLML